MLCSRVQMRSISLLKRQVSVLAVLQMRCSSRELLAGMGSQKWLGQEGSPSHRCVISSQKGSFPRRLWFCLGEGVRWARGHSKRPSSSTGVDKNKCHRQDSDPSGCWASPRGSCVLIAVQNCSLFSEYNQFSLVQYQQEMAEKEMGLIERMRLAREVKALQTEVGDCLLQLQFKEGKIQELQRMVLQLQDQEIGESIAVEEETQCSLEGEGGLQQRELVGQLADVLTQREEQAVGLHLATIEKDARITHLNASLLQLHELADSLQQELAIQQTAMGEQESAMETLKWENEQLREEVAGLEVALEEREGEFEAQVEARQNLRILQENRVTLQHIIIQNQKQRKTHLAQKEPLPDQSGLMVALLEKQVGVLLEEKEKMKKTINNYEWKLFCLETELDLSNKEKKQYKYVNDKHEIRMAELEASLKQMTIKVYSLEEEVKAIEEENHSYEEQVDFQQNRIDDLLTQLETAQGDESVKELEYRLRQKDEELTQIANYLKEKMKEHHELKLKSSQLEKALLQAQKKAEKAEFEAYEIEQCLIQHEQIMQRQTERIDQATQEAETLNRRISECSLMTILRTQEFEEKIAALQTALKEKSQKVNELSVEIIEREIECNKKLEEAQEQLSALSQCEQKCNELIQTLEEERSKSCLLEDRNGLLMDQLAETESEVDQLEVLCSSRNGEISKIVSKMNGLELAVKEKEKLMQFLQGELKIAKAEFKEARLANRRLEEEVEEMREVISVSEEKIKILKLQAVENIQAELNTEFEMGQLKRQVGKLETDKAVLLAGNQQNEEELERTKEAFSQLLSATKFRMQEMTAHLTRPLSHEETTTFEVLADEDDFNADALVESSHERERRELLEMMEEYNQEIDAICEHTRQ